MTMPYLWSDRTTASQPPVGPLRLIPEPARPVTRWSNDEETYGVRVNYPNEDDVTLPSGKIIHINKWANSTSEQKLELVKTAPQVTAPTQGATQQGEQPPVVSFNGWDFLVTKGKDGSVIYDPLGRSSESEATDAESKLKIAQAQAEAKQYETGFNRYQLDAQRAEQQEYRSWANTQNRLNMPNETSVGASILRQQQAVQDFENRRQFMLSTLNQPSDWITRWQVQNKPNPHVNVGGAATVGGGTSVSESTSGTPIRNNTGPVQSGTGGWQNAPVPQQLPKWVPQLAGQQTFNVLGGETAPKMAAPSGQMLNAATSSELGMASGYANWAGQSWKDMLDYSRLMLPENAQAPSGWKPKTQKAR